MRGRNRSWIANAMSASRESGVNSRKSTTAFGPCESGPAVGIEVVDERAAAEHRGATSRSAAGTADPAARARFPTVLAAALAASAA